MPLHGKTPEEQYKTQPKMPVGRPATKQEVWDWVVHMYGGIFSAEKLKEMAGRKWAWDYVWEVNFNGWRKQPDWLPGDPVVADATPVGPLSPEQSSYPYVNKLWAIAQAALHDHAHEEAA